MRSLQIEKLPQAAIRRGSVLRLCLKDSRRIEQNLQKRQFWRCHALGEARRASVGDTVKIRLSCNGPDTEVSNF